MWPVGGLGTHHQHEIALADDKINAPLAIMVSALRYFELFS